MEILALTLGKICKDIALAIIRETSSSGI